MREPPPQSALRPSVLVRPRAQRIVAHGQKLTALPPQQNAPWKSKISATGARVSLLPSSTKSVSFESFLRGFSPQ